MVRETATSAVSILGMTFLILVGGKVLAMAMSMIRLPSLISDMVGGRGLPPMVLWAGIVLMYSVLGCFVEGLSLMVLTLPVVFPIVIDILGFDPVWFGVVFTIIIEASLITPPVGMNLYVIYGISGRKNIGLGSAASEKSRS